MSAAARPASPQAPERGRIARLLGGLGVTGVFWYRFHAWGMRALPDVLIGPVIRLFTTGFFFLLIRIRRALGSNLDAVLGDRGWLVRQTRAYRAMHTFAWCLSERYERLQNDVDVTAAVENVDVWQRAVDRGRGIVLVTGHVGNWEVGSALPVARAGLRVHLVREPERDPRAQAMIEAMLHARMGPDYTTHFASDDLRLGLELLEALARGEIVALQGDRPRAGGKVVASRMFGRPYDLPLGPLALARLAGTPLVPVFVLRSGRLSYRVVFRDPIDVAQTGDRARDLGEAAGRLARDLEWAIRQAPDQWFCFRKLWG